MIEAAVKQAAEEYAKEEPPATAPAPSDGIWEASAPISPTKHSLAILDIPPRRRDKMTPRAESTWPQSARKTPRSSRKVPEPLSARISMNSSTFAVAVANGSYSAPAVPGEDAPGAGVSLVAPALRERNLGRSMEAWDEPVRLQSEALSLALGINWTKYNENLAAAAAEAASARAESFKRSIASCKASPAASQPSTPKVVVTGSAGYEGCKALSSNATPLTEEQKAAAAAAAAAASAPASAAPKSSIYKSGARMKTGSNSPPRDRSVSPLARSSPPGSARRGKTYTRDGRLIDVSMISDIEANLVERVQGHSTLGTPSASHQSVSKYAFDEYGMPRIIPPEITPRSTTQTPRSLSQTPRTPRSARTSSKATTSTSSKAAATAERKGDAGGAKLTSASSTPACTTPRDTSSKETPRETTSSRQVAGGGRAKDEKSKTPKQTGPRRDARFEKDPEFAKTHIDYFSRITPADLARSLADLKYSALSIQSEATTERGGTVSGRAVRGGLASASKGRGMMRGTDSPQGARKGNLASPQMARRRAAPAV